jgi:hypothetical protein
MIADERDCLGRGEMHPRLGHRVDLLDRAGELGLARLAEAFAFHRAADAHRQLVEDRVAAGRALGRFWLASSIRAL